MRLPDEVAASLRRAIDARTLVVEASNDRREWVEIDWSPVLDTIYLEHGGQTFRYWRFSA